MTDLAETSRRAFETSAVALDKVQQDRIAFFLKKIGADQKLTAADYDVLLQFPEKLAPASLPDSNRGMFWLSLQCLLAGVVVWYHTRRKTLTFN